MGWCYESIKTKIFPQDPPNPTDPDESIKKVQDDDSKYIDLNWNNIKVGQIGIYYL